jgi:hypothetical protein
VKSRISRARDTLERLLLEGETRQQPMPSEGDVERAALSEADSKPPAEGP